MNAWYSRLIEVKASLIQMESTLFNHPELGFKEAKTQEILKSYLSEQGLQIDQDFGLLGFSVKVGTGLPHVALIAELDALIVPDHPNASIEGAAHACGHHLQGTILSHVLALWNQYKTHPKGTLSCYFIAAEEFVDMEYRQTLVDQHQLQLFSGKQNLILQDAFKDVDCFLSVHTMGETQNPSMEINASLSGFIYKKLRFIGQAAHAAVLPHLGVNALNAQVLTQNAFALLRETFVEEDRIRLHLITTLGGNSVNTVPAETILEGYVRAQDPKVLLELNTKLNHVAQHCAQALFAECIVEDKMGYFPLIQSRALSELSKPFILELMDEQYLVDHQKSFAAGDMGDLSLFKPTIQLGFSGCAGRVHGNNFCMVSADEALINPAYVLLSMVEDIFTHPEKLQHIVESYPSSMTVEDYKTYHHI